MPKAEKDLDSLIQRTLDENNEERVREVRIWVNTVFILTSLTTEIARSVKGPKLQGLRAEDSKPYLVLTNLVT